MPNLTKLEGYLGTIEHKMCQQKGNKREEARSRYEGSNQKEEAIALLVGIPFHGEVWSELWREGRRGGVSTVGFVQVDFQKSAAGSRSRSVFAHFDTTNGKTNQKPLAGPHQPPGPPAHQLALPVPFALFDSGDQQRQYRPKVRFRCL